MLTAAPLSSARQAALSRFRRVRAASIAMVEGLLPGEFRRQPCEEVSPPWWNLGHTSWFFARNVLAPFGGRTDADDQAYDCVLNSYYYALGQPLPRGERGSISRPTTDEVFAYRRSVDERVESLVESIGDERLSEMLAALRIGIEHEQQHQELFYTEIKVILAEKPVEQRRTYQPRSSTWPAGRQRKSSSLGPHSHQPPNFFELPGGLFDFGCHGDDWCWDNELPVHSYYLLPFGLADRLVANAEYLEFIADGGYQNPLLWLDNGWRQVQEQQWNAPLFWEHRGGQWSLWTLAGMQPLALDEPVSHVSFYEADAFARWKAANCAECRDVRLPSEREWELAAGLAPLDAEDDAFLESGRLHPARAGRVGSLRQMAGVLWQWTSSYYEPYPGYRPFDGALAEYNGKFMDNQRVLRGGSCVTPKGHYRHTYRNFWPAPTRFQFTGIRLARSLKD